jgi:hypothetical protein
MSKNLTIESPNLDKITQKAGQETADAIGTLWAALNTTRADLRIAERLSQDLITAKPLRVSAAASVDNLNVTDYSAVIFEGGSAQNFTGMLAPETGQTKLMVVLVTGAGTITQKHNVTSETQNRLFTSTAADVTRATNQGIVYLYENLKWREVARSG